MSRQVRGSGRPDAQQREQHAPTRAVRVQANVRWAVRQRLGGLNLPSLRLRNSGEESWAALECRAEGSGSDCAPSRGLVSESAVHVVTVMPPTRRTGTETLTRRCACGNGRRWARVPAVHGQRAESQGSMLVRVPSNCQGATGRYVPALTCKARVPEGGRWAT